MARKYFSEHTRAKHTYQFFKDRRNDPKWHDEYLAVRSKRNRTIAIEGILLVVLSLAVILWWHNSVSQPYVAENTSTTSADSKINRPKKKKNGLGRFIKKQVKTAKKDIASAKPNSSQQANTDNQQKVQNYILHKGFEIGPKLYDGEPIDKAMEERKAPQNSVHDGTVTLYFANSEIVEQSFIGSYNPKFESHYRITPNELIVRNDHIPYEINNGQVIFKNWLVKDGSHTVTYEIRNYPGAKEDIDSKPAR
ncbi:MAG: hypothetical protein M3Z91_03295 [Lactobacillus apis]|nr:hypothetical protein [Lactobacillus apis]